MPRQDDKKAWQDYIDDKALVTCKPGPNYTKFDVTHVVEAPAHRHSGSNTSNSPNSPQKHGAHGFNRYGNMQLECAGQMVYSAGIGLSRGAVFEFSVTMWDPKQQQQQQALPLTQADWQFVYLQAGQGRRHVHVANGKLLASVAVEKYGTCKNGWQYGEINDTWNWGTICEWYMPEEDVSKLDLSFLASHCVEATVNIIGHMQRHLYALKDKHSTMGLKVRADCEPGTTLNKSGAAGSLQYCAAPWTEVWFTPIEPGDCNSANLVPCSLSAALRSKSSCKRSSCDTMLSSVKYSAEQVAQMISSSCAAMRGAIAATATAVTWKRVQKCIQQAVVKVGAVGLGIACCPCIVIGHAARRLEYQPDFGE